MIYERYTHSTVHSHIYVESNIHNTNGKSLKIKRKSCFEVHVFLCILMCYWHPVLNVYFLEIECISILKLEHSVATFSQFGNFEIVSLELKIFTLYEWLLARENRLMKLDSSFYEKPPRKQLRSKRLIFFFLRMAPIQEICASLLYCG